MKITLTGKNDFLAAQELARLINEYKSAYGGTTLHNFEARDSEFSQIAEAVLSLPFLAPKSMVVLRNVSEQKSLHDQVIELLDKVPDTTDLVVYDTKLDRRTAIYRALKSKTDFRNYKPLDERALTDWIVKELGEQNPIDRATARQLLYRAGEDQWRLKSEIEKLKNFEQQITHELIDQAVEQHPRETIFELLDAIGSNQKRQALKLFEALVKNRMEPGYILSMLIWQLHNMSVLVTAGDKNDAQIASDMGMSPYVVKKTRSAASNLGISQIRAMWESVLEVDYKIKSSSVDDEQIIEQLIVKLATS